VDHPARQVRRGAQWRAFAGNAHHIQIRNSAQPKGVAQSAAGSIFDVHKHFGRIVQPHSRIQRHHPGQCLLVVRTQTVLSAIGSVKWWVRLKNEIGLAREPEARVAEMREHRFHRQVGGARGWVGKIGYWRRRVCTRLCVCRNDRLRGLSLWLLAFRDGRTDQCDEEPKYHAHHQSAVVSNQRYEFVALTWHFSTPLPHHRQMGKHPRV